MIEKFIKNDLTLKRWRRFKKIRRAMISLWGFGLIIFLSITAEFWANSKPILLNYNNSLYMPIYNYYHPSEFGQTDAMVTNYKKLELKDGDWALWPIVRWDPFETNNEVDEFPSHPFWAGKREGAIVTLKIADNDSKSLDIFTTRPEMLFGATFIVLAAEHPNILGITSAEQTLEVKKYIEENQSKSEIDRNGKIEKSGVFTGAYAINPVNNEQIPIWIADYVLMNDDSGAKLAVPGHNTHEFEFANKFSIPIKHVLKSEGDFSFDGENELVNSDFLNGLSKVEAIEKIIEFLEQKSLGKKQVKYSLKEWLLGRQPHWGEFSEFNWFGTDDRGRDVASRLIYGFRYSMGFAFAVWLASYILGIMAGALMGYSGGRVDLVGQRVVEVFESMPVLLLLITLVSIFTAGLWVLVIFTAVFGWMMIAQYTRGEFLRLRKREFVEAAEAMGASKARVIFKHILPNSLSPVVTFSPFTIASMISYLAILDYLGFGLQPPTPSWGELLQQAYNNFTIAWWLAVFPSLVLFLTLVVLNLIGEGVRDAFDPKK